MTDVQFHPVYIFFNDRSQKVGRRILTVVILFASATFYQVLTLIKSFILTRTVTESYVSIYATD